VPAEATCVPCGDLLELADLALVDGQWTCEPCWLEQLLEQLGAVDEARLMAEWSRVWESRPGSWRGRTPVVGRGAPEEYFSPLEETPCRP